MLPRERFAWVWLIALVVVFGVYFTAIVLGREAWLAQGFLHKIGWLALALGSLGVIAFCAWLFTRAKALDERDRMIGWRASAVAYHVLMAGIIWVGCVMPFGAAGGDVAMRSSHPSPLMPYGAGAWDIVHVALLAIVIAELVHSGLMIFWYRRGGWHG
jgi:hypothetical protein